MSEPITVTKVSAWIPVPEEVLVDSVPGYQPSAAYLERQAKHEAFRRSWRGRWFFFRWRLRDAYWIRVRRYAGCDE